MNFSLTNQERLDLKRLLNTSDCENNTEHIRKIKHSTKIQQAIMDLVAWMKNQPDTTNYDDMGVQADAGMAAPFLHQFYPDLLKKILHKEIDFRILDKLIQVLKGIEDGKVDQHEGSVLVGKILKEMYLDSAVRHGENLDKKYETDKKHAPLPEKQISWKTYKAL
jgi:hypothetical protein